MLNVLKVEPLGETSLRHRVFLNGEEIKRVRSLTVHYDVNEVPSADLELYTVHDLDQLVDIGVNLHPESVGECVKGIQFEMQVDDEFRKAVLVGIEDVLIDCKGKDLPADVIAERILNMVFFGQ